MLHEFITDQRKKRDMAQEYVAKKLGVSRPTYAQIEKGERELTISEATELANLFEVTLDDLLKERETQLDIVIEGDDTEPEPPEMQMRVRREDLAKFRQVLLYVLAKVAGMPNVGETVLHKLLYFIDFDYYEKYEENLMGVTYIKNHHGPTASILNKILQEMESQSKIETVKSQHFKYDQTKYLPLVQPDIQLLSAQEITHIDEVLNKHAHKSAKALSDFSHTDIPWAATKDGKKIEYEFVFYRDKLHSVNPYDDDDDLWWNSTIQTRLKKI